MNFFYNMGISLLIFGMKVGAIFSYKLKRGLAGRRQSCAIVAGNISPTDKVIWMHAASLGEYEQGLPVLEKLKKRFPDRKILITFFSPSGYEHIARKETIADAVCYLPFDLDKWIVSFTDNFQTEIFFTVKYDYWYNLLNHLKKKKAKIYVISALFYEKQAFFQPFGSWFTQELSKNVNWFFHQTRNSYALAKTIGLEQSSIAGDTRFDRVKDIRHRENHVEYIREFVGCQKLIVFGSSWEGEEKVAEIVHSKIKDWKIIIAPHDLKRVQNLLQIFPKAALYSNYDANGRNNFEARVLLIDCIGLLSKIYSYADLAVVGGGFHGKGLHNILEAAVYGIPVVFGSHYQKNPEADALVSQLGGNSFEDEYLTAEYLVKTLPNEQKLKEMGKNAGEFVSNQPYAAEVIVNKIASEMVN